MDESESKNEKPQKERRFDHELLKKGLRCDLDQYDMLKRCSDKKDMTEWNEYAKKACGIEILLEGVDLCDAYLKQAILWCADLSGAQLINADLEYADLSRANLSRVDLTYAQLQCVHLTETILKGADLEGTQLEGAWFDRTDICGAQFQWSAVSGSTLIRDCKIDSGTDFSAVGLEDIRIDPGTRQLLEYNVRRLYWKDWYPKQHWLLRWLVRKFWQISDYGISTKQIIKTFFKLAFVFAIIYYIWGFIDYYLVGIKDYPGIVSYLFVLEDNQEAVSCWLVPFRAVYFSIVTMTTLGFGDMYANAHSFFRGLFGHVLLALQVILGYVLLGALVTRFAVLFTAGGPAGKFSNEQGKKGQGE